MTPILYDISLDFLPDNEGVIDHQHSPELHESDATPWLLISRSAGNMNQLKLCKQPSIRHLSLASSALRSIEQVVGVHDNLAPYHAFPTLYFCCQCGDGPKSWDNQPRCAICNHNICGYCMPAK
ncbi:uncharacterized protein BO96DRAFT_248526 [Aspergillus niger CBS 101883]|uniref:Uncharacterized protein n=1 Tax=Aspergillus niger ATCC 13496 TaxID=1353008 RepID=A0A370C2D9_ASPNG|nr:uncharacterized protein BO96DRAFT_248526 [Aspergillus niger CBS 101883]PYH50205.1 hypothetical protein BO96DRAFT_248526 [Aspergillus niger CBS 101883]RDH22074.1 hypothetical protein M747DRAFT_10096 [Aspergillus niger ATCC 13496]